MFVLDARLQQDTIKIGDFKLSELLLMNDSHYPWFILVPRRADVSELFDLSAEDQAQLWLETTQLAAVIKKEFSATKMNVATLGNVVAQLHMHVVARTPDDPSWPAPVWGRHPAVPYAPQQVESIKARLRTVLVDDCVFSEG